MKPGDEIVFIYAAVPKSEMHKVRLPEGSYGKAINIVVDDYVSKTECMKVGSIVSAALNRLATKVCPSPIIRE